MTAAVAVDLYWASLDVDEAMSVRIAVSSTAAERERAALLAGDVQRRRRLVEFGFRRALLGRWIGCAPEQIAYTVGPDGKPGLVGGPHFSASRAGGVALYALSTDAEVGVDVERLGTDPADPMLGRLARRLLTPDERAAYGAARCSERPAALAALWTRKEAHGKALGTGLRFPLAEIEVWAGDDRPVRVGDVVVHTVEVSEIERVVGTRLAGAVAVVAAPGRPVVISGAPVSLDLATLSV